MRRALATDGRLGCASRGATHASHGRPRWGAPEYERGRIARAQRLPFVGGTA